MYRLLEGRLYHIYTALYNV